MNTSAVIQSLRAFLERCREEQHPLVICYANRYGQTIMVWRETGAGLGFLETARFKAWSAVALADRALLEGQDQPERLIGGGLPIYIDGQLHGSVGVSGAISDVANLSYARFASTTYLDAAAPIHV